MYEINAAGLNIFAKLMPVWANDDYIEASSEK
jgi:hypothetical protein